MSEKNPDFKQVLHDFSVDGSLSQSFYPFSAQSVYTFSAFLFKSLPSSLHFLNVPLYVISSILDSFDFIEVFRYQAVEYGEAQGNCSCYVNLSHKVVLLFSSPNGDLPVHIDFDRPFYSFNGSTQKTKKEEQENNLYLFYASRTEWILNLIRELELMFVPIINERNIQKNRINFLCFDNYYRLRNIKIERKVENDLELNYGLKFLDVYDVLMKFLGSDETGLVLFYGSPSTGKTTFIRYLLGKLNKEAIYIPPHLISKVAEPDFLSFLLNQNDFILIIEDAEEIITSRQDGGNVSAVSNLLNLSDGILGDCIKAKVICTFNTDIKTIDSALLRKGRLKIQWEFKKLDSVCANKLFKKLDIDYETKEPMAIGDIYNWDQKNFRKEESRGPVGFNR